MKPCTANYVIFTISTGAGFLPSTVSIPEDVKNLDGSTPGPYPEENEEGGGHQDHKTRGVVPLFFKETSVRFFSAKLHFMR